MMSIIFFKANGGFGVLDIWNILVVGHEILFFFAPTGWLVSQCRFGRRPVVLQVRRKYFNTTKLLLILKHRFLWACVIYLLRSWSLRGESLTAPPRWPSSTQQNHQWEVSPVWKPVESLSRSMENEQAAIQMSRSFLINVCQRFISFLLVFSAFNDRTLNVL